MAKTYCFYGDRYHLQKLPRGKPVKLLQVFMGERHMYFLGLRGAVYCDHISSGSAANIIRDKMHYFDIDHCIELITVFHVFGCMTKEKKDEYIERLYKTDEINVINNQVENIKHLADELGITLTKAQLKKIGK